jgi:hypothetical protein
MFSLAKLGKEFIRHFDFILFTVGHGLGRTWYIEVSVEHARAPRIFCRKDVCRPQRLLGARTQVIKVANRGTKNSQHGQSLAGLFGAGKPVDLPLVTVMGGC